MATDEAVGRNGRPRTWRAPTEAAEALARTLAGGAEEYNRRRVLPRLIAIDPSDLDRCDDALDKAVRRRLARALRLERGRGMSGHWTYDLNRHIALAQALAAETQKRRRPT